MVNVRYSQIKDAEVGMIKIEVNVKPYTHPKTRGKSLEFTIDDKELNTEQLIYHINIFSINDPSPITERSGKHVAEDVIRQLYGEDTICRPYSR